jgi:hypothetical protein
MAKRSREDSNRMDMIDRIKAEGKRQRVKVKTAIPLDSVLLFSFSLSLSCVSCPSC